MLGFDIAVWSSEANEKYKFLKVILWIDWDFKSVLEYHKVAFYYAIPSWRFDIISLWKDVHEIWGEVVILMKLMQKTQSLF